MAAAAHLAAALLLAYLAWRGTPDVLTRGVVVAVVALSFAPTMISALKLWSAKPARELVSFGIACGLAWTAAVILLFPEGRFSDQLALGVATGGGALALAFALHSKIEAASVAIAVPLPAFALLMVLDGAGASLVPALLFAALWVALVWFAWQLGTAARARLHLQEEREQLIETLAQKARELECARNSEQTARREAEVANEAKSRFLAQSSHDLRQPLHAMGLVLETLPTGSDDPRVDGVVDRVKQSLAMLTQMFDSLLDLTLLDTGQIEIRPQAFSAEQLLVQARDDFLAIAEAARVEVRVARTGLWLESDPVVTRRIVQNLLSNAIRHAGVGSVLIAARKAGGCAVIDVIDTGPGIPVEDQERIFREFTTLEGRPESDFAPGVGLGLAIVQRMSAALGLEVSVRSVPGKGSRFRLSGIALAEPGALAVSPEGISETQASHPARRIAVFDDDADTLAATAALLRKWGFVVDAFESWPARLERDPDLLVCDYQLEADVTGVQVISELRAASRREIPALVITGADSVQMHDATRQMGLPVLSKPVAPAQLRSAILAALAPEG